MGFEQEIKLRAADAASFSQILQDTAVRTACCSPVEEIRMQTVYYDTAERLLSRKKWVLRCRKENEDTVITLKTPADGSYVRGEWSLTDAAPLCAGGISPQVFRELVARGAPEQLLTLEPLSLQPVCGVQFTRQRCRLQLEHATAELALDSGHLYRGERSRPLAEVELELLQGDFAPVKAFAQALANRFALTEEPLSKFQQTMQL